MYTKITTLFVIGITVFIFSKHAIAGLPGQYVIYSNPELEIRSDTPDGLVKRKSAFKHSKYYSNINFVKKDGANVQIKPDKSYFINILDTLKRNTKILDSADWIKINNYISTGKGEAVFLSDSLIADKLYIYSHPVIINIQKYKMNGIPCYDQDKRCLISLDDTKNKRHKSEYNQKASKDPVEIQKNKLQKYSEIAEKQVRSGISFGHQDFREKKTYHIWSEVLRDSSPEGKLKSFAERNAWRLGQSCAEGCKFNLIDTNANITQSFGGYVYKGNSQGYFYKLNGTTNTKIIENYRVDALIFLHHLATNDLQSITITNNYQSAIARLYYWFAIMYGKNCEIADNQKTRLQLTSTETTTYPYSSPIVTNREYTYYTVEKSFAERAAQYGNWYVRGLVELKVKQGMNLFINEYGCQSSEINNIRKNLNKFGLLHDTIWKEHDFK